MDKFVEICQEATYCMRTPQQDAAGWFLWLVWGLVIILLVAGLLASPQARALLVQAILSPTEYRGRMGREQFVSVYYVLHALRALVILSTLFAVALLGKTYYSVLALLVGLGMMFWFSLSLYCCIIRRGHDFSFKGTESMGAYFSHIFHRYRSSNATHTWQVLCTQKGSPYANVFGSAPQENNYLIPQEQNLAGTTNEFPSVWDEADWKSMHPTAAHTYQRTHWKPEQNRPKDLK